MPTPAKAEDCGSLICLGQIFGWESVAKTNAEAGVKNAETLRQQQVEIAKINAAKEEAVKRAEAEIERQRQAGAMDIAQAQAQADAYKAQVDAWADVQKKLVEEKYSTQAQALSDQTNLGLESIRQVGQTQRESMAWATGMDALILILIFAGGAMIWRGVRGKERILYIEAPTKWPQLDADRGYTQIDAHSTRYQITRGENHDR